MGIIIRPVPPRRCCAHRSGYSVGVEGAVHVVDPLGKVLAANGEVVVLDGCRVNPEQRSTAGWGWSCRLAALSDANEGGNARPEQGIEFRFVGRLRRPRVFAGEE